MISPEQWDRFFENLEEMGVIKFAAASAGIHRSTIYEYIDAGSAVDSPEAAKMWLQRFRAAERASVDTLEGEGFRRAVEGVKRPQFTKDGKPIYMPRDPAKPDEEPVHYHETVYSDQLLMFLLRARNPAKFKDRVAQEVTGKDGGPIQTENRVICLPILNENDPS